MRFIARLLFGVHRELEAQLCRLVTRALDDRDHAPGTRHREVHLPSIMTIPGRLRRHQVGPWLMFVMSVSKVTLASVTGWPSVPTRYASISAAPRTGCAGLLLSQPISSPCALDAEGGARGREAPACAALSVAAAEGERSPRPAANPAAPHAARSVTATAEAERSPHRFTHAFCSTSQFLA